MQSKQKIAKDAIRAIPPNLPPAPDGYVYLGRNKDFLYNGEEIKYGFAYIGYSDFVIRQHKSIPSWVDEDAHYVFPENSETVKLNLKASTPPESDGLVYWDSDKECLYVNHNGTKLKVQPPNKTFEEKLAEAKAMVGKRVGSIRPEVGDTFVPKNVRVVLEGEEASHSAEMEAEECGYAVCLESDGYIMPYNLCLVWGEKKEILHGSNKISFDLVKSNGVIKVGNLVHYIDTRFFLELNKLLNLNINMGFTLQTPIKIGPYVFERGEIKDIAERIEQELK